MNPVCKAPIQKSSSYFTDSSMFFQLSYEARRRKSIISNLFLGETYSEVKIVQIDSRT